MTVSLMATLNIGPAAFAATPVANISCKSGMSRVAKLQCEASILLQSDKSFKDVKASMSNILKAETVSTSWAGSSKNDAVDWCAWTASFLIRDKVFRGGQSVYSKSSSDFVRFASKTTSSGRLQVVARAENSKSHLGSSSDITYISSNERLRVFLDNAEVQPGDLVAYYFVEYKGRKDQDGNPFHASENDSDRVTALLKNPQANKEDRPFWHLGVVYSNGRIIEGNRGGVLKSFKVSTQAEFTWYGGVVVLRPEWK